MVVVLADFILMPIVLAMLSLTQAVAVAVVALSTQAEVATVALVS